MTNVRVRNGESARETAILLLAAAEEKGQHASVVQVSSLGGFIVPEEIAKQAGLDYEDPLEADGSRYSEAEIKAAAEEGVTEPKPEVTSSPDPVSEAQATAEPETKAPAKKTAAKKTTTARKTAAKKTTTKKAGA